MFLKYSDLRFCRPVRCAISPMLEISFSWMRMCSRFLHFDRPSRDLILHVVIVSLRRLLRRSRPSMASISLPERFNS